MNMEGIQLGFLDVSGSELLLALQRFQWKYNGQSSYIKRCLWIIHIEGIGSTLMKGSTVDNDY